SNAISAGSNSNNSKPTVNSNSNGSVSSNSNANSSRTTGAVSSSRTIGDGSKPNVTPTGIATATTITIVTGVRNRNYPRHLIATYGSASKPSDSSVSAYSNNNVV